MPHDHGGPHLFPDPIYRTIFENTGTAMTLVEEDTTISLCNEEFARLAGLPRSEIEGRRSWTEFVHPDDLPRMREYPRLRRLDPASAPRWYEFRFVSAKGEVRNVRITTDVIPGTRRSVASLMDITELRKEEALGMGETYYRAIFEAANDAIFVHDPETGRILDVNPRMTEMYGYTAEEARQLTVEDLSAGVPPYTQREALAWIKRAAAGEPQVFEWLARDRQGRLFWVEVNLKRATIGGRNTLLAIVRDITVPKETQTRLEEAHERFRVTLTSIGDAVICTDPAGKITFVNPVAGQLTGWPAQEALGRPLGDVFRIVSELTGRPVENPVARVLREGAVVGLGNHTVLIARDGRRIPIADSAAPIRGPGGNVLGVVLVFRDETERRRVQREVQETKQRLERALEDSVRAVARLAELRDPYTAGHQQRVAELACTIAREMGLPENAVDAIRIAGYLHDIGKTTIPAAILYKPGPLTPPEMALVKLHPVTAYEVLRDIDFGGPVATIVRQHHERLNGSGYPDGLAGPRILLAARILAVADVVDAMTSHRPYRPAHTPEAALEEIRRGRGTLYDPDVVDTCLRVLAP